MKHVADTRKPYSGLSRSLVIAIDVGTTFSGVSYAILEPGEIPKIHGVTRFPGQEHVAGNSKIPSVLYYDKRGNFKAAGAETESSSIQLQAEEDGWIKVELFKLRLRPRTMHLSMNGLRLAPLPPKKSPVHIFGDFLAYLYACTRSFITDTHANGASLFASVADKVEFVLAHPNGWEGAQQTKMRRAAVWGGLVPDSNEGRMRIRFVTEGEASLHACVLSGLAADVLSNPSKNGFLIADAGGGTLDISSYAIKGTNPLVMEEIAPPDCIFAGSVFVSRRAREFFEQKLKKSQYGSPESLDHIAHRFDETTKRLFRDRTGMQWVHFGSPLDKDPTVGIRAGQLRLTGNEVANLFEPSVDAAVNAIKAQIDACGGMIKSVFLVGGYAASPWLFNQLQERLAPLQVTVSRPDTQTSKAVADGAIGFYCDHHVSARMSKFMYGVEFLRVLDLDDPDHVARQEKLCELPSGPKLLPDAFDCILARGVKVKESTVFTRKYCTELTSLSMLRVFEVEIWCYRGGNIVPKWINRRAEDFSTLCVVKADLSMLSDSAAPKQGKNGKTYWTIIFSVEIHFGLTEFKARIKWAQDGQTKYGPATIVYNERGHRTEEDEPDFYPEDDAITSTSGARADRNRSEPSPRARTPTEPHYVDSSRRSSQIPASLSGIPDVTRAPSSKPLSSPSTPSKAVHASLDRDRGYESDIRKSVDKGKDRERDRDKSVPPTPIERTRSNKSNILGGTTKPNETLSPLWNGGASHPTTPAAPAAIATAPSSSSRRSRTPGTPGLEYVDPPPSVTFPSPAKGEGSALWDTGVHASQDPYPIEGERPNSFFGEDPKSAFGTPKSMFGAGGSSHTPKSVFGDVDQPRSSIFGDNHDIMAAPATSMSVFGEPASAIYDDIAAGGADHLWKEPDAPAASSTWDTWGAAPSTDSPKTKSGKKKTPIGSGAASRNSPAFGGGGGSTFGQQSNFDSFASPVTARLGSKAPSPNIKPPSPLNPVVQQTEDSWGWNDTTADVNAGVSATIEEPVPVAPVAEEVQTPVDDTPATTPGGKKKKKKASAATTPSKSAAALAMEEEERSAKEDNDRFEKEEKERKEWEENERLEREEIERQEKEREEGLRFEREEQERKEQEERERKEKEKKEKEKKKKDKEEKERKKEEEEERVRKKKEEDEEKARKKKEEEEEKARKKKEQDEEKARRKKEAEKKKEADEEKARKLKEADEEKARKQKEEEEEKSRKKKEADEEKARKQKEEEEQKSREKKEAEEEKARKKKEAEEEKERLQREEEERQRVENEKAEAARLEKERLDTEEKKLQEELDQFEREGRERKEKGESEQTKNLFSTLDSGPTSLFGGSAPISLFGNSGGGFFSGSSIDPPKPWTDTSKEDKADFPFGTSWGAPSFGSAKKKSKANTPVASSPLATTTPSKLGWTFSDSYNDAIEPEPETSNAIDTEPSFFGDVNLEFDNIDLSAGGAQSTGAPAVEESGKFEQPKGDGDGNGDNEDDWGQVTVKPQATKKKKKGKGNNAVDPEPSRAPSPTPETEATAPPATTEGGEGAGEFDDLLDKLMADGNQEQGNEDDLAAPAGKGKKKKKGKAAAETLTTEDLATPIEPETPKVEEAAGGKKKKKKK